MRNLLRLYGFGYGCVGTIVIAYWLTVVLAGNFRFPDNWLVVEFIAALHGIAACVTFQPNVRPAWKPLFSVTRTRVAWAKSAVYLASINFVICFVLLLISAKQGHQDAEPKLVALVLTSFLLQNTIYIAAHWAFRPENFLPGSFIEVISNPLGVLSRHKKK